MRLSEVSIRRPVFATVISLLLIIFGLVCLERIAVREYGARLDLHDALENA